MLVVGLWWQNSQRMVSTPTLSAASSKRIELPFDLCISSPCSSRIRAYPSSVLNGRSPSIIVLMVSIA